MVNILNNPQSCCRECRQQIDELTSRVAQLEAANARLKRENELLRMQLYNLACALRPAEMSKPHDVYVDQCFDCGKVTTKLYDHGGRLNCHQCFVAYGGYINE